MKDFASTRSILARGVSAGAFAVALMVSTSAMAQTTATLQGRVEGASAGQQVRVTDTVTGRTIVATTRADGSFTIVGLRPSTYRVEAEGQEAQDVSLPVGQIVNVDLGPAEQADAGEDVVVTGTRGRTEVRSATIGTSVSQAQMESLPQSSRNFLNFAALAPGVTLSSDLNNVRIQAGGVSSNNVNVFVDGTSQKNQVGFGGVAGQNFSQGNPFPQSAIQEFRVETQNFKAEYENAGSAIITAITKTGGSEFSGGAFGKFIPRSFYGQPFFDRGSPKPNYNRWEFGADLGGPIIPDVLHFFATYEGQRKTQPGLAVNLTDPSIPASIVTANSGSFPADFKQDLYFGKLTLFASDRDTLNASFFMRQESDVRDYGGIRLREGARDLGTESKTAQFEWSHRGEGFLNELSFSYFQSFTGTPTISEGPEYKLINPTGGEVLIGGANSFQQANEQESYTFKNNFTYTGWDSHVVKAGIKISMNTLTRIEDANANGSYTFNAVGFTGFDSSIPVRATIALLPPTPMEADNVQVGLFVQDDWTIDDHWTVNLGLRWDYESNNFNNNYRTPEKVATALRNYQPWQAAGINPEDYITDGTKRKPFMGAFQPRIGISYDVNGDRDLILFAGAGRYYDRNIYYSASLETLFNNIRSDATVNFCGAAGRPACSLPGGNTAIGELQWNPAYRDPDALRAAVNQAGLSGDIWVINNDAKVPYTDQFTLGVRKRVGPVQLSAAVAHNRSHDAFIFVRGNRQPDGNYTPDGDAWIRDNFPASGRPAGYTGRLNIGSSKGEARFTALYLTADKTYTKESGWGATASLTVSDAKSNQAIGFDEGQMFNAGRQDAFGWQPTRGLERWRFVATGMGDLPWGFQLAGTLTLGSGPRFGNVDFGRTPSPNCVQADGVTPGGCTYYNDAGVFSPKSDIAYKNLDLRIAKTFKVPGIGGELTADFEVFNVFDWVNRNYSTWGAGSGANPPLEENSTVGYARTFQAGLKYRF